MLKSKSIIMSSLLILLVGLTLTPFQISAQEVEESQPQIALATISGKVVDAQTQSPIANVNIEMPVVGKTATTDEEGKFTFENLNPGKYTLEVNHEGYQQYSKEIEVSEEGLVQRYEEGQQQEEQQQEEGEMGGMEESEENLLIIKLEPVTPPNR